MERNYLVPKDITNNLDTLSEFVTAVLNEECSTTENYPNPLMLKDGRKCLNTTLVEYYLDYVVPFDYEKAVIFFEALRKVDKYGFNGYSHGIGQWIEKTYIKEYFNKVNYKYVLKPDVEVYSNPQHLKFICYVAICHLKYGASFESVTANRYFDVVTGLGGEEEIKKLKKTGSGTIPADVCEYTDNDIKCKANDAFATIKISLVNETEATYGKTLDFINALLKTGQFPKSYSIEFRCKEKHFLPIKGLQKASVNALFAGAVRYSLLHDKIEEYAHLAMNEDEWYNNLTDEESAMPSTFAVFALGLYSEKYFPLVEKYMNNCDDEHSAIQEKFTPVFVEKYGITENSFPIFISCILSMQEHAYHKLYAEQLNSEQGLTLLLDCRDNLQKYVSDPEFSEELEKDPSFADYVWRSIYYTIWKDNKNFTKYRKSAVGNLKALYDKLFLSDYI